MCYIMLRMALKQRVSATFKESRRVLQKASRASHKRELKRHHLEEQ